MAQKAALSANDASIFTGFSKNYIYKLVHLKKIPFYKPLGGRLYFKQDELENFLFGKQEAVIKGGCKT